MPLRDPSSVGVAKFTEDTAGLALIRSIGAGMKAAKVAKDKEDKAGTERALKVMAAPINAKWDIDAVQRIQPQEDAIKKECLETIADNEKSDIKGITSEQEIYFKSKWNSLIEEATRSNAERDDYLKDVSYLTADGKGDKYDHDKSEENLMIRLDAQSWLDKNSDKAGTDKYKQVAADLKDVKATIEDDGGDVKGAQYLFRSQYGTDHYPLVPTAKSTSADILTYLTPKAKEIEAPITEGLKTYNTDEGIQKRLEAVYDSNPMTAKGISVKDAIDKEYNDKINAGTINKVDYPDAKTYFGKQYSQFFKIDVTKPDLSYSNEYNRKMADNAAKDVTSATDTAPIKLTIGTKTFNGTETALDATVNRDKLKFTPTNVQAIDADTGSVVPDKDRPTGNFYVTGYDEIATEVNGKTVMVPYVKAMAENSFDDVHTYIDANGVQHSTLKPDSKVYLFPVTNTGADAVLKKNAAKLTKTSKYGSGAAPTTDSKTTPETHPPQTLKSGKVVNWNEQTGKYE